MTSAILPILDPGRADASTDPAVWVAGVLRDRIVKGSYPSGSRIVERTVSAELAVSRTPVREALKLLHADGLVRISRHKGAHVLPYDADEALALFEVLAALEGMAAERLASTIDDGAFTALESLHARMMNRYEAGDLEGYFDSNTEIHDRIVEGCANPILIDTYGRLIARARRGRYLAIMDPRRLEEAVAEHEGLMAALRRRHPGDAAGIWRRHLLHSGETVAKAISARAVSPTATQSGHAS